MTLRKHWLLVAGVLGAAIGAGLAAYHYVVPSATSCGYTLPGASPLWAQQSQSLRLDPQQPDRPIALWDTGEWHVPLRMLLLSDAIDALDSGATSAPAVDASDTRRSFRLRSIMCPHVLRSASNANATSAASIIAALRSKRGIQKAARADGFLAEYYGGAESIKTLDEYLRDAGGDRDYWVSHLPVPRQPGAKGATDAAPAPSADVGLRALIEEQVPLALLGLTESHVSKAVVRVSRTASRVPMHYDAMNNLLLQVAGGSRRVLLLMPDNAPSLYPEYVRAPRVGNQAMRRESSDAAVFSRVDPRHIDLHNLPDAARAWALTATLQPGDALFIPAGWFHYVETVADSHTDADADAAVSVALNLFMQHRSFDGETATWCEHPCPRTHGIG